MIGNLAIFWPVIVQACLTFGTYFVLVSRRRAAIREGAGMEAFRLAASEPDGSATAVRNVSNQFELPVLFYVVCIALYVTNGASWLAIAIAWVFVLSRLVHAAVHLGSNRVRHRFHAFLVGFVAVVVLWLLFALHLLGIG